MDQDNPEDKLTELEELDFRCGPLMDMLLEFEKAFCAHALDVIGLTDEEVDKLAQSLLKFDVGTGVAYRGLLQEVKNARVIRRLSAMCDAIYTTSPERPELMNISEVCSKYAQLKPGDS